MSLENGMAYTRRYSRTAYRILIDDRTFLQYFFSFIAIVVVFGLIYTFMPSNHGIEPTQRSSLLSDLLRGLYLSIVTISSLGYGDLRPIGLSRFFAGVEVVLGLALIGITIAKLTSERVSHLVSSIYISDTQRKLDHIASLLNVAGYDIRHTSQALAVHYQQVPHAPEEEVRSSVSTHEYPHGDLRSGKVSFNKAVSDLKSCTREFREYLFGVTDRARYVQLIPDSTLANLAKAIEAALSALNRSVITLYPLSTSEPMDRTLVGVPRTSLSEIVEVHKRASTLIANTSKSDEIRDAYSKIADLCDNVSVAIGPVPEEEVPDQVYKGNQPVA